MKVIGITGGVGAGKSEVMRLIEKNCASFLLVADEAAHELEKKGSECYNELIELLSADILSEDGEIDKRKMAEKLFKDDGLRERVNAILHPAVKRYILSKLEEKRAEGTAEWFFIEAALLIEDGYVQICDELWYIYADEETRRKRLKESRGYTDEKTEGIMKAQNTDEVFRRHCAVIIDNSGSLSDTETQILSALSGYDDRKNRCG